MAKSNIKVLWIFGVGINLNASETNRTLENQKDAAPNANKRRAHRREENSPSLAESGTGSGDRYEGRKAQGRGITKHES